MRICLVRLPSPYLINEKAFPPLGLLSIATVLKNHDVMVYDGPMGQIPMDFEAYGLGPSVTEYSYAKEAKDLIRKHNPEARIVIGGPHATLNQNECLNDGFDCVVIGDGEPVVEEAFKNKWTLLQFGGEDRNLDDYPIIDRSFINLKDYEYIIDGKSTAPIVSSKGCPFRCGFCSRVYNTVRMRSPQHVIQEINYLHFDLGYDAVMFFDDTFIVNRNRVYSISSYLKRLGMKWRCLLRGDLIVKYGTEFVKMLADNNCVEVGMGIESGSDKILSIIHKGESTSTIKKAIRLLKDHGIRVKGFFILGLPGEDKETLEETELFVAEVGLDDMDFSIFKPYSGSDIYANPSDYDIQWDDMDYSETFYKGNGRDKGGNIRTSKLSHEEIVSEMYRLEAKYKYVCQRP